MGNESSDKRQKTVENIMKAIMSGLIEEPVSPKDIKKARCGYKSLSKKEVATAIFVIDRLAKLIKGEAFLSLINDNMEFDHIAKLLKSSKIAVYLAEQLRDSLNEGFFKN